MNEGPGPLRFTWHGRWEPASNRLPRDEPGPRYAPRPPRARSRYRWPSTLSRPQPIRARDSPPAAPPGARKQGKEHARSERRHLTLTQPCSAEPPPARDGKGPAVHGRRRSAAPSGPADAQAPQLFA